MSALPQQHSTFKMRTPVCMSVDESVWRQPKTKTEKEKMLAQTKPAAFITWNVATTCYPFDTRCRQL